MLSKRKISKYTIALETNFFEFINNMEANINNKEKLKKELDNIKSTPFYQKVRWDMADNSEKMRIQHENNCFFSTNNERSRYI
jgi:hypothetical protein